MMISCRFTAIHFRLLLLLSLVSGYASAQGIDQTLTLYFADVRAGNAPALPKQISLANNAKSVLVALLPYETDTMTMIRSRAYAMLQLAAGNSREQSLRQEGVRRLVQACKDAGNGGQALEYLAVFRKEDFTPASKDSVRSLFKYKNLRMAGLFKLAGYLGLADMKETIRVYTQNGSPQAVRWAALISLVRMNDAAAAADMMKRVRKQVVNDDLVYQLFPDLVYTRHPEAIAYMVEAMNSNDNNCLTADAEREVPIPCGYRIMEQLAPVIDKYPVELDESGDIESKDYAATLQKVREWFAKNKNYKILRDKY
jgi:hypothetical protein